jgi:outer membrane protein TolC
LEEIRDVAEKTFQAVDGQAKVGVAKQIDVHQAKAALLEIRIELLREELKLKPAKTKKP